ncbi:MAG: glycosyl transferase [Burkholderiales bacterium]|nr:glycosyl transferase [Bacteroidia bacterium]
MKLNFVTLFNSNYLSRGLVMYQSLQKHCPNSHLYVVAFDDITYNYFHRFPQKNLTAISLEQFEDEKLLSIKYSRSGGEYCWTCTASTVLYAINTFKLDHCVYVDADMRFYSNPQVLFDEWGAKSVLITEHRYTSEYDQSLISGNYCVQFVGFKNDKEGMKAVNYWRESCIEWCYARAEDGKFGDQKYLDDWTTRFKNVHVLEHLGGGLAPWNIQQYEFHLSGDKITGKELKSGNEFEAVFFHFHGLKIYKNNISLLTGDTYEMTTDTFGLFYKPYLHALAIVSEKVHEHTGYVFNSNGASENSPDKPFNFLSLLRWYFYDIRQGLKNLDGKKTLNRIKHHHYINING